MKRLLVAALLCTFLLVNIQAQESRSRSRAPEPAKTEEVKKEATSVKFDITGTVVSVNELVHGGAAAVTKEKAEELAAKGQPLGIMVGKTLYIVFNANGTYAGKKLAKFAGGKVGIIGKKKTQSGLRIIIANKIASAG